MFLRCLESTLDLLKMNLYETGRREKLICVSFLPEKMKDDYRAMLEERISRL